MNCSSENNEEIAQLVSEAESSLLPVKSRAKYEKSYQEFCHWRNEKDVQGASEDILIAYFCEKVKILKSFNTLVTVLNGEKYSANKRKRRHFCL
ncbi:hypothetical protein NQ315_013320 [Exocentrus adspersus]|uniref:Uncharacterized protein n=1 Tax=Exocentrus adspersus TaxID=1586481 RepID=A0AAV8V7A2_9CUCU|nr:hypothetical protein NQ315_013320 [Exocentrus adspersus]